MVAGVMALREPTSSSLPQTQPQPLPFFQPLTSADFSSALRPFWLSSARASSTIDSVRVETRPATNATLRASSARMPRSHFIVYPPRGVLGSRHVLQNGERRDVSPPVRHA